MNKQIGDHLASEGIALIPFYGSSVIPLRLAAQTLTVVVIVMRRTELGSCVRLIPDPDAMEKSEWDYFQISPHIDIRLLPQEGQPDIFEPVAFVSSFRFPHVLAGDS